MTSSVKTSNNKALELVHRLPEIAFTRSGVAFSPNEDVWAWTDGPFRVHLDFRRVSHLEQTFQDSLKYTLLVFAKRNSASHLTNLFNAFLHFLALRPDLPALQSVSMAEVSSYAARLKEHERYRIGTLNVLLQKWGALGLAGVDAECTQYLRERRKPGNDKGAAVRQRDPVEGPFSETEYTALYKAVDAAYGMGDIARWVVVLTRLLFACGGRISQYASLKVMDLNEQNGIFVLNLPQVKTREENSRVSFKEFHLSPQTGRLVLEHIASLPSQDANAALFPESLVRKSVPRVARRPEGDLFFGHCTRDSLSAAFSREVSPLAPPTERLDFAPTPVTTKRFRSTFGTRLAEEGAGRAEIAERLGHADLQHVDVYFEGSPIVVDNIDKALGHQLAPLARAFKGRVVQDEEHSTHKGAPGSRIIDFRVSIKPIASCAGQGQGCAFNKPVACYTCFRFEPWLDGPHEKVLKRLQEEREKWAEDERMAAINDDAIEAVREVLAECAEVRAQQAAGGSA